MSRNCNLYYQLFELSYKDPYIYVRICMFLTSTCRLFPCSTTENSKPKKNVWPTLEMNSDNLSQAIPTIKTKSHGTLISWVWTKEKHQTWHYIIATYTWMVMIKIHQLLQLDIVQICVQVLLLYLLCKAITKNSKLYCNKIVDCSMSDMISNYTWVISI